MTQRALLPLTVGLLVSAMMRSNHAVFAPWCKGDPISALLGPPTPRILAEMDRVLKVYDSLCLGQKADPQICEEFQGKGFYSPEREAHYASALEPYDLVDAAVEKILRRTEAGRPQ